MEARHATAPPTPPYAAAQELSLHQAQLDAQEGQIW